MHVETRKKCVEAMVHSDNVISKLFVCERKKWGKERKKTALK